MRKLIVFEWISLDGIYDAASMNLWWNPYDSPARQQQIQEIINDCDGMLYGRKTYELLRPYWSSFQNNEMGVARQLNRVKKYVVSKTLRKAGWEHSEIVDRDVIETVTALKRSAGGNILIIGSGTLVTSLMKAGLVDELHLLVQPYIMGTGERLFSAALERSLELVSSRPSDKGVLHLAYRVSA